MEDVKLYRADFEAEINGEIFTPDSEYFTALNDDDAVKCALKMAEDGWDYAEGHADGELTCVTLVDGDNEYEDIKVVWY